MVLLYFWYLPHALVAVGPFDYLLPAPLDFLELRDRFATSKLGVALRVDAFSSLKKVSCMGARLLFSVLLERGRGLAADLDLMEGMDSSLLSSDGSSSLALDESLSLLS